MIKRSINKYIEKVVNSALGVFGLNLRRIKNNPLKTLLGYANDKDVDLIIDVGANIGQFSTFIRRFFKDQKIIAFEPLPSEFCKLKKKFTHDLKHLSFNIALGCKKDKLNINYLKHLSPSSSLLKPNNNLSDFTKNKNIEMEEILVKIERLDDFLLSKKLCNFKNGFLKIDVQGYELNVLKGIRGIKDKFKYILFEVNTTKKFYDLSL